MGRNFPRYIVPLTVVHGLWQCDDGPQYLYFNNGAYGTANWPAPSTDAYAVLIVNYSVYPVSGTISITTVNATVSVTAIRSSIARRIPQICPFRSC